MRITTSHGRTIHEHPGDLQGSNLRDLGLNGVDFDNEIANGTNFTGLMLKTANFHDAYLMDARFCDCIMEGVHILGANLDAAGLQRAEI